MKRLTLFFMLLSGITFAQNITVEATGGDDVDFTKYKTFSWSSQVDNKLDEGLHFLNDLILKADVREAVQAELEGLGFQKSPSPDLVVNFRVFDKDVTLQGFDGMGTNYWGMSEVNDQGDGSKYDVKAGTLMLHLVDIKTGKVLWQAFASGLINGDAFIKDEAKIKEAVNLVFNEFGQRATEYTKK